MYVCERHSLGVLVPTDTAFAKPCVLVYLQPQGASPFVLMQSTVHTTLICVLKEH